MLKDTLFKMRAVRRESLALSTLLSDCTQHVSNPPLCLQNVLSVD